MNLASLAFNKPMICAILLQNSKTNIGHTLLTPMNRDSDQSVVWPMLSRISFFF